MSTPLSDAPPTTATQAKSNLARSLCLLLSAAALIYALLAGLKTVVDFDLGWQMAAGRYLFTHHAIPRTELFSYTAHGVEFIYPILSCAIFYLLYQLGGYAAISWLCALSCVACAAILVYKRNLGAIALAILAVPVLASEIMPRASLFTMLLFTAFARLLLDHYEDRRAQLWPLSLLMLLWVNLHTGFIAGLALIAAYLIVEALELPFPQRRAAAIERIRSAAPWLLATVAATSLNPWGWRIFLALTRQQAALHTQSAFLEEWQPVQLASALQELGWRTPDSARWWLLALGLVFALVCLYRRRIGPALLLLAAAGAFLQHSRLEGPCIILICLIGGSLLDHASFNTAPSQRKSILTLTTAAFLITLAAIHCVDLVTNRTYLTSGDITLFGARASWWLPEDATNFLLKNHLPTQVFSSFNLSSYLVWKLGEPYPDFADGRYLPFGEQLFDQQRTLTALPLDSDEWTRAADTWHINTIIFPLARILALGDFPLLADCGSKLWRPVYLDTAAIIFTRSAASTLPPIDCHTAKLQPTSDRYQSQANAAAIYIALGRIDEAQAAAQQAQSIHAQDPTLIAIQAQIALAQHRYGEAEAALQSILAIKRTDAAYYNLALLYLNERRIPEAIDALQRSAALSQQSYDRYLLLAKVYLLDQQPQQALKTFEQAAHASPYANDHTTAANEFNAEIAEGEAAAWMQLQQPVKAAALQRHALQLTPGNPRRQQALAEDCKAANITCTQ